MEHNCVENSVVLLIMRCSSLLALFIVIVSYEKGTSKSILSMIKPLSKKVEIGVVIIVNGIFHLIFLL